MQLQASDELPLLCLRDMIPTAPPSFPPELEREIFEMAATELPETIPTLVLVAHRVLQWYHVVASEALRKLEADLRYRIDPLLYRTLRLTRTVPRRDKVALVLAIRRAPAKFTKYTQNLIVLPDSQPGPHDECAMLLMSLCSGISRLALFNPKPAMLPALDNMRLDHLSCSLTHLFGIPADPGEINPRRPLFQALTHLTVWDISDWVDRLPIAALPTLTHLCLHGAHKSAFLLSMLKKCDRLHILVNMYWSQMDLMEAHAGSDFVDPRLVLIPLEDYLADWAAGAKGGQDFWARAERFVAKKRRGEIKPASRCWIVEEDLID